MSPKKSPDAAELRQRAEAQSSEREKRTAPVPAAQADTQRLVHELQVHQIELEMQNEELMQARTETEAALRQYADLYDFAPVGYFTLGRDGIISRVNLAGASLLGVERQKLVKRRLGVFVHARSLTALSTFLDRVFTSGKNEACEIELSKDGAAPLWVRIEATTESAERTACRLVMMDMTERKQAEEALRESERQMNALVTSLDDIVFEFDDQGTYLNVWAADESLLAQPKEQLLGKRIADILGEENGRPFADAVRRVMAGGQSESIEYPLDIPGGKHWFVARINPILAQDRSVQSASMLIRDITERRQAAERIQIQLEHLNALREIDTVISSSFDLKFSLDAIVSRIVRELQVDAVDVLVLNSESRMLEYQAGSGFRSKAFQDYELQIGDGPVGRCIRDRKSICIRDLRENMNGFRRQSLLTEEKFIGYYCVPLINKRETKGVLEIFHHSPLEPEQDWVDFLETLAGQTAIAIESATMFNGMQRSNMELRLAYDGTIEGWSRALDLRDEETEGHTLRVTEMTVKLARAFGLSEAELLQVRWGSLLHDIGKMGVPDNILLKPGPLDENEWVLMKKHPSFAYEMLSPIRYLCMALDIPYCHHEKWDGSGYPRGLKGEVIPLVARIFAIVDVWDALGSDRTYRAAWTQERIRQHLIASSGTHFDPQVVDAFLKLDISSTYGQ